MASFNRVIIVGNLCRDIELRHTSSGTAVTDVSVAVNDKRKQGDDWVEETTFVDVTLWGRTAEVAHDYLGKGSQLLIEGRLKMDEWEDRDTGKLRKKLKVVGEKLTMLGSRDGGGGGSRGGGGYSRNNEYSQPAPEDDGSQVEYGESNLPF